MSEPLRNFISSAAAYVFGARLPKSARAVAVAKASAPRLVRSASMTPEARRSSFVATVVPVAPRQARSISLVSRGEHYDEYERRMVRGHSAFKLTPAEQEATGFPEYVGFGPENPSAERDTKKVAQVEVRYSARSDMPVEKETVWRRIFTGHNPLDEGRGHSDGREVHLGELTEEGASRFKEAVESYDSARFDVTGTAADNCAQFVKKMAGKGLGMQLEEEPDRHETSASITSKIKQAVCEELADPVKNPLARELRTIPASPDKYGSTGTEP